MKRISLIRTSSDRKSEPSRRDERCARVGITGASVRYEGRLFEVIEGTDHHVDAEVALLRNLPDADVVIVGTELDISHRTYSDWSERGESPDRESSSIERASELASELSSLVQSISDQISAPTRAAS